MGGSGRAADGGPDRLSKEWYGLLVIGSWLLVIGDWLLVNGDWLIIPIKG
jgi:hypothetical protein